MNTTEIYNKMMEVFDDAECIEEIPHTACDGFIPFTNGGYSFTKFIPLFNLFSSGYRSGVEAIDDRIEEMINYSLTCAKEYMIEKYPDLADVMDHITLDEMGKDDIAEELFSAEMDFMDEDTLMLECAIQYYAKGNSRNHHEDKDSLYVFAVVNWETPYHRHGRDYEHDIFPAFTALRLDTKKIDKALTKAKSVFDQLLMAM